MHWFAVGAGGFVGAVARFGLTSLVRRYSKSPFPMGTLMVNLLGCLLIGVLLAVVELRPSFSPHLRSFLVVGLLGSLTTFSTFGHETFSLMRSGATVSAVANIGLSVTLGLVAVILGRSLVRVLLF